jgi:hypothetical protein
MQFESLFVIEIFCIHILLLRRITSIWNNVVLARRVPSIAFPFPVRSLQYCDRALNPQYKLPNEGHPLLLSIERNVFLYHPSTQLVPVYSHQAAISTIPLLASQGWKPNLLRVYG